MIIAVALLASTSPGQSATCNLSGDAIETAIKRSTTCQAAAAIAKTCAYGASGDTSLSDAVIDVCERDFLVRLDARQTRRYRAARSACERRYARKDGTMYRSADAFCQSAVAVRYSDAARWWNGGRR